MNCLRLEEFPGSLAEHLQSVRHGVRPRLYWLGQAGFLIVVADLQILIDPYLSDSLEKKYAGKQHSHQRMMPAPIRAEQLAGVDYVLCTHRHGDHMDPGTLAPLLLLSKKIRLVVPKAVTSEALDRAATSSERLICIEAGEIVALRAGVHVTATRAAHETLERDEAGRHLFLGYMISINGCRIWHSGDCVPFPGLIEEVSKLRPHVALLPVNGRSSVLRESGVPGNFSLDEAIDIAQQVGARSLIAHHYGMFSFNTVDPELIDAKVATNSDLQIIRAKTSMAHMIYER